MKRFLFQTSVENAEGSQTWYVDAKNKTEALQKYSNGDCDIYASEVVVTSIGQPELAGETTLDDFGDFRPTQPKEHLPNMSEINRTIAYSAAATLHELGYEWKEGGWVAQQKEPEQEPNLGGHDVFFPVGITRPTAEEVSRKPAQEPVARIGFLPEVGGGKYFEKLVAWKHLPAGALLYTTTPQRKHCTFCGSGDHKEICDSGGAIISRTTGCPVYDGIKE